MSCRRTVGHAAGEQVGRPGLGGRPAQRGQVAVGADLHVRAVGQLLHSAARARVHGHVHAPVCQKSTPPINTRCTVRMKPLVATLLPDMDTHNCFCALGSMAGQLNHCHLSSLTQVRRDHGACCCCKCRAESNYELCAICRQHRSGDRSQLCAHLSVPHCPLRSTFCARSNRSTHASSCATPERATALH